MVARNHGRYVAPIALVAVIVALVLVIQARVGTAHHRASSHVAGRRAVAGHAAAPRRFYIVRAGDTLSTISVKTGVSIPRLESLNPAISPNALQTGQRLRLAP
jgi:LysM repeat protein